jgi:O-antigen ligase
MGDAMTEPRRLIRTRHLVLACFWALPLWSLTHVPGLSWHHFAVLLIVAIWTVWRPAAGLLIFALLLPLAFALVSLGDVPLNSARVVEGALLALLAGWSLHLAIQPSQLERSRLGLAATSFALVIFSSALIAVLGQFGTVAEASRQIWRQMTVTYMTGNPMQTIPVSLRWLEVLGLALMAERTIRLWKSWTPLILAAWLGAGAAVAAQTVVRVAQVVLSRGLGWQDAFEVFQGNRFGAIYPDINAAGSMFALLVVTAVLFTIATRRWLFGIVTIPILLIALLGTQSRAAIAATIVVFGGVIVAALVSRGRRVVGLVLAAAVIAAAAPVVMSRGATHVSAGAALSSRVEMWRISLKIAAEDPIFGVGAGRFQIASRDYLTDAFIASFPEAAVGENAHNNFLQVLAELGLTGFIGFAWLLWAALHKSAGPPRPERNALVAGLAAFLFSALFGHPLLIYEIAVAFFLVIGLTAGLGSPPERSSRLWQFALVAFLFVTLPWRAAIALEPPSPDVVGATPAAAELDGQAHYVAESVSRWRLRAHARAAVFPMRWDGPAGDDCRVGIFINGKPADEVSLRSDTWLPVPLIVPRGGRESVPPEVELKVAPAGCKLLVGAIHAWR